MNDFDPYILIPMGIMAWVIAFLMVGISKLVDLTRQRKVARAAGTTVNVSAPLPVKYKIWRWIFLCSETACLTMLIVAVYRMALGTPFIDTDVYPVRGGIVVGILIATPLLQLGMSPFFFRSVGFRAILAWVTAVAALVWWSLPTF
jgi:energy-converting hydrogenase Eha subunit A